MSGWNCPSGNVRLEKSGGCLRPFHTLNPLKPNQLSSIAVNGPQNL